MLEVDAEPVPTTTDDKVARQSDCLSRECKNKDSVSNKGSSPFLSPTEEFYDAAVLYSEKDYEEVNDVINIIKRKIILENGESPKIDFFDVISPTGEMFMQIQFLLKKCSCIIIYLTDAFLKDSSLIYQFNELLINEVKKQTNGPRNWQLVLLTNTTNEVPIGMKSLCLTKWYSNKALALRKLEKILKNAQILREKKEKLFVSLNPETYDLPNISFELKNLLTPSPEFSRQPITYHAYNSGVNVCYNVNATNVQIGENSKIYGAPLVSSDQKITKKKGSEIDLNQNQQANTVQQNLFQIPTSILQHMQDPCKTKNEGEINVVHNVSEANVHVSAPLKTSTERDPLKDISKAKGMKEAISKQISISKDFDT